MEKEKETQIEKTKKQTNRDKVNSERKKKLTEQIKRNKEETNKQKEKKKSREHQRPVGISVLCFKKCHPLWLPLQEAGACCQVTGHR